MPLGISILKRYRQWQSFFFLFVLNWLLDRINW